MADKEFVILRRHASVTPTMESIGTGMAATVSFDAGADLLEIEESSLSKADRHDVRRDPRTMAVAESMPMRLIAPVAEGSVDVAPLAGNPTWGVSAVGAAASHFDGSGVTVAVLDTGIEPGHPAFQGVTLVRENFTSESPDDVHGHGTHCAGTIFGRDVGNVRIGVARNVTRALIGKVLGQGGGSSATISKAILWAMQNGAHVVSMSLGIDFPGAVKRLTDGGLEIEPATSLALEAYRANVNLFRTLADTVRAHNAFMQGMLLIAAAGNESNRPQFEIAVAPPAAALGIVSVAALREGTSGLTCANFSNNQADISGPGVAIVSAGLGGGLRSMSGTSMATPHVAGVAALWAQRQFDQTGMVRGDRLAAEILASGTMAPLAAGAEAEDVGTGLVQAP